MGDEIKAEGLRGVGLPQVAMHSQLPRFLVIVMLCVVISKTAVYHIMQYYSDIIVLMLI